MTFGGAANMVEANLSAEARLRQETDRYGFLPGSKEYTDPEVSTCDDCLLVYM